MTIKDLRKEFKKLIKVCNIPSSFKLEINNNIRSFATCYSTHVAIRTEALEYLVREEVLGILLHEIGHFKGEHSRVFKQMRVHQRELFPMRNPKCEWNHFTEHFADLYGVRKCYELGLPLTTLENALVTSHYIYSGDIMVDGCDMEDYYHPSDYMRIQLMRKYARQLLDAGETQFVNLILQAL